MLRLDTQTRETVRKLEAEKRSALAPAKKQAAAERKADRKARSKVHVNTPGQRHEREHDKTYLAALRRRRCCVGAITGKPCDGRIDPAHIRFTDRAAGRLNPGLQNKSDDRWCLAVCRKHHDEQHAYGNEAKWWAVEVGVDPNDLARETHRDFELGGDGETVLRQFIPSRRTA